MTKEAYTEDQLASVNQRVGALADQLYEVLGEVCDRQTAYLSIMQVVLARSGLEAQDIIDLVTTLLAHNLCGDAPIRLAILPAGGDDADPTTTKH